MHEAVQQLRRLAAGQHGVVSREQCRALGLSAADLRPVLRRGELERLGCDLLRVAGSPDGPLGRLMAAVLDAGQEAVASHRSAAALWRIPGYFIDPVEVTRGRNRERRRPTLGRVHEPRLLLPHHCTVVEGIPVTTPARTLFDLAGVLHPQRTARAVDNALAKSPALLVALHRMLPELAKRGRTGIRAMREILAARPLGYVPPASGLEARAVQILEEAGIRVRRQVDLGGDDWIGRVDLLVERTNVVVEVDSVRFHSSLLDRERDEARDAALRAVGLEVVRVAEEDVWHAPATVVRQVRSAVLACQSRQMRRD